MNPASALPRHRRALHPLLLLMLLAAPALARETLPESAPPDTADMADMATRFPAPALDTGEMEELFLSTPTLLTPADDRLLTDEQRFVEQDPGFRERLRSQEAHPQPLRPEQIIPPPPTTGIPARPL